MSNLIGIRAINRKLTQMGMYCPSLEHIYSYMPYRWLFFQYELLYFESHRFQSKFTLIGPIGSVHTWLKHEPVETLFRIGFPVRQFNILHFDFSFHVDSKPMGITGRTGLVLWMPKSGWIIIYRLFRCPIGCLRITRVRTCCYWPIRLLDLLWRYRPDWILRIKNIDSTFFR